MRRPVPYRSKDQRSDGVWLKVPVPTMPIVYDPDHLRHFLHRVDVGPELPRTLWP